MYTYRAFHGFGQAKFPDGGYVLGYSQFSIMPQLPPKTILDLTKKKLICFMTFKSVVVKLKDY